MKKKIVKFYAIDFDGTLGDSPMPDVGKKIYKEKTGKDYPHKGWWGRPESLDIEMFDIKPFKTLLNIVNEANADSNSYVIILTSRMEKLRPQLQAVLDANNIKVDKLDMKKSEKTKGDKVLEYIKQFPDLKEVNVYDDRDTDIASYKEIESKIPRNIQFNIYLANEGKITIVSENKKLGRIINEEIKYLIRKLKGLYL